ncbi:hypothetical protein BN903_4 [Halorubrum sp. AJ67]|nr:hypothetical protein BN903_4 [Halorubrum sp. AJ67]
MFRCRNKFLVMSLLDDLVFIHHDNPVGVLNHRKPVSNNGRRPLLS